MLDTPPRPSSASDDPNVQPVKRKRRPAGTPDPDAEVVSLSPKTLLESDRYVCEICNQGFQRDQNLQMHRRRHKVPWNILKRHDGGGRDSTSSASSGGGGNKAAVKKRVYVCPEPTCLHHDPCHALGDLVGIKKHFRRKHSSYKQWVCERCGKGYAVQSDYKAHLKTCGTRGHSCDCGRVFSRVESFIEHQDACNVSLATAPDPLNSSRTASSPSPNSTEPSNNNNFPSPPRISTSPSTTTTITTTPSNNLLQETNSPNNLDLHLSVGPGSTEGGGGRATARLRLAAAEKAFAEEARRQARQQVELAEEEFENAKRIRTQAQAELERAHALKEEAFRKIASAITQVTCPSCKRQFAAAVPMVAAAAQLCDEGSTGQSIMSSTTTAAAAAEPERE